MFAREFSHLISYLFTFVLIVFTFLTLLIINPVMVMDKLFFLDAVPGAIDLFEATIAARLDLTSLIFICVVLFVGLGAQLYSVSYMSNDFRWVRFCTLLLSFTLLITLLVISDSFWVFFIAWELIGLVSFMLINFWSTRPEATLSAEKAVIANRVCDLALFISFLVLSYAGITGFGLIETAPDIENPGIWSILLVFSSLGKSAQAGFHGWLINAMEGPTPVSALMHAATLVTAGALWLLKLGSFIASALFLVFLAGAATALVCGLAACLESDLKTIIAYSTSGQIGFVFMLIGCSESEFAWLHLSNHAIFKSLLFFAAGLIIHTYHNQFIGIRGLGVMAPIAVTAVIISTWSLLGVPFSSGFFSKEAVIISSFSIPWGSRSFFLFILFFSQLLSLLYNIRTLCLLLFYPVCTKSTGDTTVTQSPYLAMQFVIATFSLVAINFGWFLNVRTSALYQMETIIGTLQPLTVARVLNSAEPIVGSTVILIILTCLLIIFIMTTLRVKQNALKNFKRLSTSLPTSLDRLEEFIEQSFSYIHSNLEGRFTVLQYSLLVTAASGSNPQMFENYRHTTAYLPLHVIVFERVRLFWDEVVCVVWNNIRIFRFLRLSADILYICAKLAQHSFALIGIIIWRCRELTLYYVLGRLWPAYSWSPLFFGWPEDYLWVIDFDFWGDVTQFWQPLAQYFLRSTPRFLRRWKKFQVHLSPTSTDWYNELRGGIYPISLAISLFDIRLKGARRVPSFYFPRYRDWWCPWEVFKSTEKWKTHILFFILFIYVTDIGYVYPTLFLVNTCAIFYVHAKLWRERVTKNRVSSKKDPSTILEDIF